MTINIGTFNIAMISGTLKGHGNETDCSIFLYKSVSPQVPNTVKVLAILPSNSRRYVMKNRLPTIIDMGSRQLRVSVTAGNRRLPVVMKVQFACLSLKRRVRAALRHEERPEPTCSEDWSLKNLAYPILTILSEVRGSSCT
jgi:hypothetical protein